MIGKHMLKVVRMWQKKM